MENHQIHRGRVIVLVRSSYEYNDSIYGNLPYLFIRYTVYKYIVLCCPDKFLSDTSYQSRKVLQSNG